MDPNEQPPSMPDAPDKEKMEEVRQEKQQAIRMGFRNSLDSVICRSAGDEWRS